MSNVAAASELLKPCDARLMRSYPASPRINHVVNDDAECSVPGACSDSRIGYSHNPMTNDERMQRESSLIATIRKKLPDFAKACADDTELVLLHQDSLATDYQEDEYTLLGMAIKYAGLRGKEVRVIGKNRNSLDEEGTIQ
jgi:hypothetical protein